MELVGEGIEGVLNRIIQARRLGTASRLANSNNLSILPSSPSPPTILYIIHLLSSNPFKMDRTLSSLRQFRTACPYLARTPTSTLRKLSTASLQGGSTRLSVRAEQCPVMSDALNQNSNSLLLAVTDNKASPSAFNSLASVFSSSNGNLPFSTGGDSSSNSFNHQKRSFSTSSASNKSAANAASSCPFSNLGGQQTRS